MAVDIERRRKTKRTYRHNHRDKANAYNRLASLQLRLKVIETLGNKCVQCGVTDYRALQIDHINGDGHIERRVQRIKSYQLYKSIVLNGHQDKYQLLCANCNAIKKYELKEFPKGKKAIYDYPT